MPDLAIHLSRRSVYLEGRELQLSPQEFRLLLYIGNRAGAVVAKQELVAALWPGGSQEAPWTSGDATAVDAIIFRLRKKLGDPAHAPTYLETRRGFGYLLHNTRLVTTDHAASPAQAALSAQPSAPRVVTPLAAEASPWAGLTRREWQIFLLLGDEQLTRLTNQALAQQLRITEHTLKKHLQRIYRKLGVSNRSGVALLARRAQPV